MHPFTISHDPFNNGKGETLRVVPTEVVMSIDDDVASTSVTYHPGWRCITVRGHVEVCGIDTLEQALGWYASRLHVQGRLKFHPIGFILPMIQISYGSGMVRTLPYGEDAQGVRAVGVEA